jgi:hypothetical protein
MTKCYFCDKKITPKTTVNLIDFYTNSYKACLECGKRENDSAERCEKFKNMFIILVPWLYLSFHTGIFTMGKGEFYDIYITVLSQVGLSYMFYSFYKTMPITPSTIRDMD